MDAAADFTLLAGYKSWQSRGRQVKAKEKSIRILAPMVKKIKEDNEDETMIVRGLRTVSVFDIAQTEGDEIEVGCSDLFLVTLTLKQLLK